MLITLLKLMSFLVSRMFTNEPTVVNEDASRVWLISDIRATEVGRLGVPDSAKRAELVWETISFDADTGSLV